jgi:hypothetical protein
MAARTSYGKRSCKRMFARSKIICPRRQAALQKTLASGSGSPLGQGVAASFVLRLRAVRPGCDLSEEAAVGIGPFALDCRVAPECPPGPVLSLRARLASRTICS